jgi:hypothetical protein
MLERQLPARGGVDVRNVGGAVVGHDFLNADAVGGVELQRSSQERDCRWTLLVSEDLGVGQAAVIIDRDVHELPASQPDRFAVAASARPAAAIGGNPMARFQDSSQLLDVDVDQLAG